MVARNDDAGGQCSIVFSANLT
jgi:hypothetical protein